MAVGGLGFPFDTSGLPFDPSVLWLGFSEPWDQTKVRESTTGGRVELIWWENGEEASDFSRGFMMGKWASFRW